MSKFSAENQGKLKVNATLLVKIAKVLPLPGDHGTLI